MDTENPRGKLRPKRLIAVDPYAEEKSKEKKEYLEAKAAREREEAGGEDLRPRKFKPSLQSPEKMISMLPSNQQQQKSEVCSLS